MSKIDTNTQATDSVKLDEHSVSQKERDYKNILHILADMKYIHEKNNYQ